MQQVIEKLKMYANQIDITTRFDYSFNTLNSLFTSYEIQALSDEQNLFSRNVRLKWILKEKYENAIEFDSLDFWIINDWGGIRSFKPIDRNKKKIKSFRKQLKQRSLSKDSFSTISSLSKLSSFNDPDNFVIYDSRVIYSLNWLILTCENQKSIKVKYFPMPSGRNRIISDFDMNTILNLFHLSEYNNGESFYISYQQAYFDFCDFVKSTTTEVFGSDSKPYQLEMLLFTLADREIFEDIKGKIKITTAQTVHKTNTKINLELN